MSNLPKNMSTETNNYKKQMTTKELVQKLQARIPVGASPTSSNATDSLDAPNKKKLNLESFTEKLKVSKSKNNSELNKETLELKKALIQELKRKLGIMNTAGENQVLKVKVSDLKNFSNVILDNFIATKDKMNPGVELLLRLEALPHTFMGELLDKENEKSIIYRPEGSGIIKDDSKRINKLSEKLGMLVNDYTIRFEDIIETIDTLKKKLLETYVQDIEKFDKKKITPTFQYPANEVLKTELNYPKEYKQTLGPSDLLNNLLGESLLKDPKMQSVTKTFQSYSSNFRSLPKNQQKYYKKYNKDKFLKSLKEEKAIGFNEDNELKLLYYARENQLGSPNVKRVNDRFYVLKVNPITQFVIAAIQSLDRIRERTVKYKEFFDFDRTNLGENAAKKFDRRNLFINCFNTFNTFDDASLFMVIFLRAFLKRTSKTLKEIEILVEQQPEEQRGAFKALLSSMYPFYHLSTASK